MGLQPGLLGHSQFFLLHGAHDHPVLLNRGRLEVRIGSDALDLLFFLKEAFLLESGFFSGLYSLFFAHSLVKFISFDAAILAGEADADGPGWFLIRLDSVGDSHVLVCFDGCCPEDCLLVKLLLLRLDFLLQFGKLISASGESRQIERGKGGQFFGRHRLDTVE